MVERNGYVNTTIDQDNSYVNIDVDVDVDVDPLFHFYDFYDIYI